MLVVWSWLGSLFVASKFAAKASGTGTHWAAIFTTIASVIAAAGVGGVIWAAHWAGQQAQWAGEQVRQAALDREQAERAHQAAAVIDMVARWESQPLFLARRHINLCSTAEELRDKYIQARDSEGELYYVLQRVPNFFEDLGIRFRLKCVDLNVIDLTLGSAVKSYWDSWEPIVLELRPSQPKVWENFQQLALKLREIERTAENRAQAAGAD